jgi:hypothetical protein
MRKNWLTTTAGIMAALGTVPVLIAQSGAHLPAWWGTAAFVFVLIGTIGVVLLGVAAKGQDEHSTADQVQLSTIEKHVDQQMQAQQQNKSAGA